MGKSVYRLYSEKLGTADVSTFIGRNGELFYDPSKGALRVSDGHTAGGNPALIAEATIELPVTQTLYVDGNRTDSYTQVGNIFAPFKTIQAALDVATQGTTIYVATGTYNENIVIPDLDSLAIIGASEMNTIISNATPGHTITWIPGATSGASVNKFTIQNIDIENTDTTGTYHAVHFDASAVVYPNVFLGDECDFVVVDIDGQQTKGHPTAYFNNIGALLWWHGQVNGGDLTVINPGVFRANGLEVGTVNQPMNFNATYDGNLPRNLLGRNDITIAAGSVVWGDVILSGHPIYQEDTDSLVFGNLIATNLSSFYASGRDYCPTLLLYGQHGVVGRSGGNITITFPDAQSSGSALNLVDFSNSHVIGNITITKTNYSPANSRGVAYVQGQGQFDTTSAGGITFNGYVAADFKGTVFNNSAVSANVYSVVDRTTVSYVNQAVTTGGTTINISPALSSNAYAVAVTPTSAATVFVSNKTSSSFRLTSSVNTNVDVVLNKLT